MMTRKPYPSDVSDEEWSFVAPYLALIREDAPQRDHDLREVFNALRWIVRTGSAWRYMPHDLPPWEAVYQQTQRWINAGVFEAMVHDLRMLLRISEGRVPEPTGRPSSTLAPPDPPPRAGHGPALRRGQAQERLEGTRGGGHPGTLARLARRSRRRAGPRAGG